MGSMLYWTNWKIQPSVKSQSFAHDLEKEERKKTTCLACYIYICAILLITIFISWYIFINFWECPCKVQILKSVACQRSARKRSSPKVKQALFAQKQLPVGFLKCLVNLFFFLIKSKSGGGEKQFEIKTLGSTQPKTRKQLKSRRIWVRMRQLLMGLLLSRATPPQTPIPCLMQPGPISNPWTSVMHHLQTTEAMAKPTPILATARLVHIERGATPVCGSSVLQLGSTTSNAQGFLETPCTHGVYCTHTATATTATGFANKHKHTKARIAPMSVCTQERQRKEKRGGKTPTWTEQSNI